MAVPLNLADYWHDGSAAGSSTPPEYREEIDSGRLYIICSFYWGSNVDVRQSIPATPGGVDVIVTWEGLPNNIGRSDCRYADEWNSCSSIPIRLYF